MKYADHKTPAHRYPDHLKEILDAMMDNRRSFSESDKGPPVTDSIRYTHSKQDRLKQTEEPIDDDRSKRINELFDFEKPIGYQHEAWQSIGEMLGSENRSKDAALVSAPTGFGKTEAFLGPLLDALAAGEIENVALVYPRTALLRDQLGRVLNAVRQINDARGAELSVGPYYGDTPFFSWKVPTDYRLVDRNGTLKMTNCWCGEEGEPDPAFKIEDEDGNGYSVTCTNEGHTFSSEEFVLSRQAMKDDPPNIFVTTLQSLESSCLKTNYNILEQLDAVVIDEVHLYQGIYGSHAARIFDNLRRIKKERYDGAPLFIGASATLDSPKRFTSKMFDIGQDDVSVFSPNETRDYEDPDDVKGTENYYFVLSSDKVSLASTFIQQGVLFGHTQLEPSDNSDNRGKMLSFIDSVSSVNQKRVQFQDADANRQLWQYHNGFHGEDWEYVAEQTGHQFIDSPLRVQADHSQTDLTADDIANSDVLISTSTLEVGIDLKDIDVIMQYHAPYDLSSFVQRAGRAGRQTGDSHIVTFLSNTGGDKSLFNRADRFLNDKITTPLNPDNRIVEWVHDALYAYYMISVEVDSQNRSNREFLEALFSGPDATDLSIKESIDYKEFYRFLISPDQYLTEVLDINVANLFSKTPAVGVQEALENRRQQMQDDIEPIAKLLDRDVENYANTSDPGSELLAELRDRSLGAIDRYQDRLKEIEAVYDDIEEITEIQEELSERRETITDSEFNVDDEDVFKKYRDYQAKLREADSKTSQLPYQVDGVDPELTYTIGTSELESFEKLLDAISGAPRDHLRNFRDRWQATHYLNQCLEWLIEYHDTTGDSTQSAYAIKHLLRSLYYFHRYLGKRDEAYNMNDQPDRDVYYVPEQYFEAGGTTFTLVEHSRDPDDDSQQELSERSLFEFFTKYYPLRTHFTQSGEVELFQPPIQQTPTGLQFDFRADRSQVEATRQAEYSQPDAIPLKQVEDCSGSSGQMILNYCPDCYEVMDRYETECPRHGETKKGKLYSDPIIRSRRLEDDDLESVTEGLQLGPFRMELRLQGVDISEYRYGYDGESFFRLSGDPINRTISIPEDQEIGFEVDTKGLVWQFDENQTSNWVDEVLDQVNTLRRNSTLDRAQASDVRRHTAAHLLMLVTADVAGVKTDRLHYHIDDADGEVVVYEQAEGGQGIVDLACEELQGNPSKFLDSLLRVSYDPSVISLQCWASTDFVESLQEQIQSVSLAGLDTNSLRPIVRDVLTGSPETSFIEGEFELFTQGLYDGDEDDVPSYIENIEQEILSYIDRLDSLQEPASDRANISLSDSQLVQAGHAFAQATLGGENPNDVIHQTPIPAKISDAVTTLFREQEPDGCIDSLHVHNCTEATGGEEQSDFLSHVLLQTLRKQLISPSLKEHMSDYVADDETLPALKTDSAGARYFRFK